MSHSPKPTRLKRFGKHFEELAHKAGIDQTCRVEFPRYMSGRNARDPRSFAEVDPGRLCFYFAPEVLDLPEEHQRGLIAHELGHVLAFRMGLPGGGSEDEADRLAHEAMGVWIEYDVGCCGEWGERGLQRTENPPQYGYRENPSNRFPGKCAGCGVRVPEHAGSIRKEYGKWSVYCNECLTPAPEEPPHVKASLSGDLIEFRLGGSRAPRETFDAYRKACVLCNNRKIGGSWVAQVPFADAAPTLQAMADIPGLALIVDESITQALRDQAAATENRQALAAERLEAADAMLAQRGQALYPFQRTGVFWLAAQEGAILADDMGLGKTVQALIAAPEGAPILVIAPAVAKGVWVREAGKWRPDLSPVLLSGRGSFRWPEPGEMVVTNYEILSDHTSTPDPGTVVIADEAHQIKNSKAKRTQRFRALATKARANGGRVWLLTATPILGKPPELWSLLRAIDRVPFVSWDEYADLMGGRKEYVPRAGMVWQWNREPIDPEVAERLQSVMLRRLKTEVLPDLPAKRYQHFSVDLKKSLQRKLTKKLKDWNAAFRPDELPPFETLSAARAELADAKIDTLMKLVEEYEEANEPLVVFSAHRAPIDEFDDREGWAVITGDTSPDERTSIEEAFQAGELRGVAATIQAGGVAITLTRASNAIFVDLDWTPALNSQAEDRIYRIGQDRGVLITRLVADHVIDQRITQILDQKGRMITASVDAASRSADEYVPTPEGQDFIDAADAVEAAMQDATAELADYYEAQEIQREQMRTMTPRARKRKEERLERERQDTIKRAVKRRKTIDIDADSYDDTTPHPPEDTVQGWVADALARMRSMDHDFARYDNYMGFAKSDVRLGHALAIRANLSGLTDLEWRFAEEMLRKYHRQIGRAPRRKPLLPSVATETPTHAEPDVVLPAGSPKKSSRKIPKKGQLKLFENPANTRRKCRK